MILGAKVGKIVGASQERTWGQVFQSEKLFLVVEVSVPQDFEAAPLGKEIIEILSSGFNKLQIVTLEALKNLVNQARDRLPGLPFSEEVKINIVLCALADDVFYLVIRGGGKAFLKRAEKIALLLENEGGGSGVLEEGDLLILASPQFCRIISFETLKSALNNLPPLKIAENLAPLVHTQEDSFGAAALILKFKKEKKTAKEEKPSFLPGPSSSFSFFSLLSRLKKSFLIKKAKTKEEETKRMVLTVALILTFLLLISIIFGFGKREKTRQEQRFQEVFGSALHKFEEGKALLPLNLAKSREILQEAKKLLEQSRGEFKKGSSQKRRVEALLGEIEKALKEAAKVYKLERASLFFDPQFLKDQAKGSGLSLYKESLAILDKNQEALYYLSIKEKKGKILAGGEVLRGAQLVGIHGQRVYVLTQKGIVEVGIGEQGTVQLKIKREESFGEIVDLSAYRGNVYLLNKKEGIVKYLKTEEGFSKRSYLAPGVKVDFSQSLSMAIDGEIWVAKKGKILRFSLGQKKEFAIKGLEKPLGDKLLIYTDENCENLYLLDKEQKRIVVLNKEGDYQAQYQWEKLGEAQDLVASEKEGKILVLVGGKIYGLNIKN